MRRTLATLGVMGALALGGAPVAAAAPAEKIDICHAVGPGKSFLAASVSVKALDGHAGHSNDIIPPNSVLPAGLNFDAAGQATLNNGCVAPANPEKPGTPAKPEKPDAPAKPEKPDAPAKPEKPDAPAKPEKPGAEKIDICHATGSDSNPFVRINISINGLNGHGDHSGDIIPPNSVLPAGLNFDAAGEATFNNGCEPVDEQEETPADPEKPGTPAKPEKIEICHATGSDSNPFVRINISINGLNGHGDHSGDIIPPNSVLPAGLNFDAAGEATFNNGCVPTEEQEPVTPGTPEEPVTPGTPEEPVTPGTPEEPVTPEEPITPGTPEEPVTPVTPEEPVTPQEPTTPADPEGMVGGSGQDNPSGTGTSGRGAGHGNQPGTDFEVPASGQPAPQGRISVATAAGSEQLAGSAAGKNVGMNVQTAATAPAPLPVAVLVVSALLAALWATRRTAAQL